MENDMISDSESFHNKLDFLVKRYRPTGKGKQLWTSASLKFNFCSHEETYTIKNGSEDPENSGSSSPIETREDLSNEMPRLYPEVGERESSESSAETHRESQSLRRGQFQSNAEMPFENRRTQEEEADDENSMETNSEHPTLDAVNDSVYETKLRTSFLKTPDRVESDCTASEHSGEGVDENFEPKPEVDDDIKSSLNPIASTSTKQGSSSKEEVWKCPDCPKDFLNEKGLRQHLLWNHLEEMAQEKAELQRKSKLASTICRICGKKCLTYFHLRQHMTTHAKSKKTQTQNDDLRRYNCEECGKRYKYSWNMDAHMMEVHVKDSKKNK